MKISIGSDHRGYELKQYLITNFLDIEWLDVGTNNANERVDYPIFAKKVCDFVLVNKSALGILICGSGVGISIAANRFKKIYAALCWDEVVVKAAKEHDLANVLVLPADFISKEKAINIVDSWLKTEFKGGRYLKRLEMLN